MQQSPPISIYAESTPIPQKTKKSQPEIESVLETIEETPKSKKKKNKTVLDEIVNGNHSSETNPLQKLLSNKNKTLYLLKLPKDINPKDLYQKTIPVNENSKVRLRHKEKLEITVKENSLSNCQVLTPSSLHLGELKGILQGKRHFKVKHAAIEPVIKNLDVEQKVKERHPIFGSSFNENLAVDDTVLDRLENPLKVKKKKHKRSQDKDEDEPAEELPVVPKKGRATIENPVEEKHKNKKKKRKDEIEDNSKFFYFDVEGEREAKNKNEEKVDEKEVKKKKKKKKVKKEAEVTEDDSDNELDVFSILTETKQRILGS